MLSKLEIDILNHLFSENLTDSMNSRTVRNISLGIGINHLRVRNNLNHLLMLGMVKNGWKERNANSFHITQKGVDLINENKTTKT